MTTESTDRIAKTTEPMASDSADQRDAPGGLVEATPQNGEDTPGVKERIEMAAIRLFGEKGFAATSVREIVESAGVTKPTLYYYFKDKDDLYESLIFSTLKSFHNDLAGSLESSGSIQERLEQVARIHFENVKLEPLTVRFMFRALFGYGPQDPRVNLEELAEQNSEVIRSILREAALRGEIPASAVSDAAVIQFIGAIHIYMMRNAVGIQDNLSPNLAKQIVSLYLSGLCHSNHS